MRSNAITCADVDDGDLESRYAAGELSEDEAEAVEEHFFACDRCWTLVQRAVEIRAVEGAAGKSAVESRSNEKGVAHRGTAPAPIARRAPAWRNPRNSRWLALAAAATIIVVGTWRIDAWRRVGSETVAMRGPTDSLHVVTETRGTTLIASWARAAEATSYRVRLYSASGTVLHRREVTDTSITLAAATLPKTAPGASVYWEIQAINRTRQVVARSGLHAVQFPRLGR